MKVTEDLLQRLRQGLGRGRASAMPGSILAGQLGVAERTIRALVEELRDRGVLVGSTTSGGYFLIVSREDLEVGTSHLRSRALSLLHTFGAVRRAAMAQFAGDY